MTKKKRILKELAWFICTVVGGIILCLIFYDIINVDINPAVLVVGGIVAVIAVYVIRLTLWVFKQSV
ncbi:hypothetical protein OAC89_03660 [Deltaproteobacteria bacterium]|nr:hypothetical protein [Deltaproteobacteria bacterium]